MKRRKFKQEKLWRDKAVDRMEKMQDTCKVAS